MEEIRIMSALPSDIIAVKSAYALIVGIGQYQDEHFPRLNFTHADAQSFSDLLLNPNRAGFSKENVKLLLDEQATLSNIKKAISGWLFKYIGLILRYLFSLPGMEVWRATRQIPNQTDLLSISCRGMRTLIICLRQRCLMSNLTDY